MKGILPQLSLLAMLGAIKTALLDGASLRLFKSNTAIGQATVASDLTEADFSGYAAAVIAAWNQVYLSPGGLPTIDAPSNQFNHSGGATSNSVYGWYVTDAGGALLAAARFADGPYTVATANDSVDVLARVQLPAVL